MKNAIAGLVLAIVAGACCAGEVGPITEAPNYPPPFGTFEYNPLVMKDQERKAAQLAIVGHYGYAGIEEARKACMAALARNRNGECITDPVAHKHNESPELKKYGFSTWLDAVAACTRAALKNHDTLHYCSADPFVRLRASETR